MMMTRRGRWKKELAQIGQMLNVKKHKQKSAAGNWSKVKKKPTWDKRIRKNCPRVFDLHEYLIGILDESLAEHLAWIWAICLPINTLSWSSAVTAGIPGINVSFKAVLCFHEQLQGERSPQKIALLWRKIKNALFSFSWIQDQSLMRHTQNKMK